jgi:hypothetical protein
MDVLLSLEGEYILSTRLRGQEASPGDKVGDRITNPRLPNTSNPNISLTLGTPHSNGGVEP